MTTLCAPPTVWRMLIQQDLAAYRGRLGLRELIGAGEPLNPEVIERVRDAWGLTLRDGYGQTRDHRAGRQRAGPAGQARLDGPAAARLPASSLLDADGRRGATRARSACSSTRRRSA